MEKTISVDWDSYESVQQAIQKLKCRRGELNANPLGSRKDRNRKIFDACVGIWESNIEQVYENLSLDNEKCDYYVYLHCDPGKKIALNFEAKTSFLATMGATHQPVYVGKGCGNRCFDLDRNGTHRKFRQHLQDFGKDLVVVKIKEGLTELEALCYESKLIDILGIQGKGGRLLNLDEGAGYKHRREIYQKHYLAISKAAQAKAKFNGDDTASTGN